MDLRSHVREDFLKTLDVVRTTSLMETEEWQQAFKRLRQYQRGWWRTQRPYVIGALVLCSLAWVGLGRLVPLAIIFDEAAWGVGAGAVLIGVIVAQRLAWIDYERTMGIEQSDFHAAEVLLNRFKHQARL